MGFSNIKDTKLWKEMEFKIKEMEKDSLLNEPYEPARRTISAEKEIKEPFAYQEPKKSDPDHQKVSKREFHRLAKQLTAWGVWNSGSVIKKEGAVYVKQAVDLTLACIDNVENPGAYFRSVLKNLQNTAIY